MKYVSFILVLIIYGCTKEKRYENRIEGHTFILAGVGIDGKAAGSSDSTILIFSDCKNRKKLCTGTWSRGGQEAKFYWRFRKNGKQFEFSNQTSMEYGSAHYNLLKYCYEFSGLYTVTSFEKKGTQLFLESTETVGYYGKKVQFSLLEL